MISRCGRDCEQCSCYKATRSGSDDERRDVAAKWSRQYQTEIKPEQICCHGCTSEKTKFYFTEICDLRKCNIERNTPHCAACSEYQCDTLKKFIQQAPVVGRALEKLRSR